MIRPTTENPNKIECRCDKCGDLVLECTHSDGRYNDTKIKPYRCFCKGDKLYVNTDQILGHNWKLSLFDNLYVKGDHILCHNYRNVSSLFDSVLDNADNGKGPLSKTCEHVDRLNVDRLTFGNKEFKGNAIVCNECLGIIADNVLDFIECEIFGGE